MMNPSEESSSDRVAWHITETFQYSNDRLKIEYGNSANGPYFNYWITRNNHLIEDVTITVSSLVEQATHYNNTLKMWEEGAYGPISN